MKKLIVMAVLAVFTAGSVMAQNDSVPAEGKKKVVSVRLSKKWASVQQVLT